MKYLALCLAVILAALTGCETMDTGTASSISMNQAIRQEAPGNYFVGRRMYKEDYKMWGWLREPGQPWRTAKLVMFNEQKTLAPDRAGGKIGTDNGYEYKLTGYYSGETIYEPASNSFYPEFVLVNAEVLSTAPPNIYKTKRQNDPAVRLLTAPPN